MNSLHSPYPYSNLKMKLRAQGQLPIFPLSTLAGFLYKKHVISSFMLPFEKNVPTVAFFGETKDLEFSA